MFAADERVKKAQIPDTRRHWITSGYGFLRMQNQTMIGKTTRAMKSMLPTRRRSSLP